jgi:hypothetical protein
LFQGEFCSRSAINCNAASMASGEIARRTSAETAASMRPLLKTMHFWSAE